MTFDPIPESSAGAKGSSPTVLSAYVRLETTASGVEILRIDNDTTQATVSLFGGQVLEWQPRHATQPVLWLSPGAILDGSKAIRGGVPICWPWFGAHPNAGAAQPAHGYARIEPWQLDRVALAPDGEVELDLSLPPSPGSVAGLRLMQRLRIGKALDIEIETHNQSGAAVTYSEGLHTYFAISDIGQVRVTGLEGRDFVDLTAGNQRRRQEEAIAFDGEFGRIYVATEDACTIEDPGFQRRIRVEKRGSLSTAVWNPALEVASRMSDLGATAWRQMVCVETANALEHSRVLEAGASHTMGTRYLVEPWAP